MNSVIQPLNNRFLDGEGQHPFILLDREGKYLFKFLGGEGRSPLFTAILDFLYPGKKLGRLAQPTHGLPPESRFPFPAQSKCSACDDHVSDLGTLILK